MNKEKIAIGFDLGTTSVGWSVIKVEGEKNDKKLEILDMGVRLFDDPAQKDVNSETRRLARGRRRRINRLKIRKKDLMYLLKSFNLIKDQEEFESLIRKDVYDQDEERFLLPVEIKIKGLTSQLSKHELILILHNYIKHRGTLNTIDLKDEDEKNKENDSHLYDTAKYPCENQYEWFKTTGKIIGNKGNYLISNEDYKKEIQLILSNQSHLNIDENFINKFITLFERHRHYSEGPGSENSPTKYGRFEKTYINGELNLKWVGDNEERGKNLWDLLVGKCTYYPDEVRNYKKSPITEIFNLLNDLANIQIFNREQDQKPRYLTIEEKNKILKLPYNKLTLDKIAKEIGFTTKEIYSGIKKDAKDKFVIEELKSTKAIMKWLVENNIKESIDLSNIDDLEFIDNIYKNGVKYQNFKERVDNLIKNKHLLNINNLSDEHITLLAGLKIWSSGTSSLSKKAQLEFIKWTLTYKDSIGKNQMHFFNEETNRDWRDEFSKYKYFPNNYFENIAMPLTVKRTFNQTVKVLNAILKEYEKKYDLTHIIIELARELNSAEEAKRIENQLSKNKREFEKILELHGLDEHDVNNGDKRLKLILFHQQNKLDIYDGETIDFKDVLRNPIKYHIDHILPISISFIDSMQNKVLTKAINNAEKGDKTPCQWLSSIGKYEEYKDRCKKLINEIPDKKDKAKFQKKLDNYLLYEKDPFSELSGFVERQLNDTRYVSREISNQLKRFFSQSNIWKNKNKVIIHPVNGAITNFARNNIFIEPKEEFSERLIFKNRDIYNHHAIDASIIAFLGMNHNIENLLKLKRENIKKTIGEDGIEKYVNLETGEISAEKTDFLFDVIQNKNTIEFRNQMRDFLDRRIKNKQIKFSRMKLSKNNIPLSNETLYSIKTYKDKNYKMTKIKLLEDIKNLHKYFGDNPKDKEKLSIYKNEINLYNKLNTIYKEQIEILHISNLNNKNPFLHYLESEIVQTNLKKILNKNDINSSLLDKLPIFNQDLSKITHWIRELKIYENEIDVDEILTLKRGHNGRAFYDKIKPIEIRVYKNIEKNKFQTIFINALNVIWDSKNQKLIPDENKIKDKLSFYGIDIDQKPIIFKIGDTLINNNDLYYVSGGDWKANKLEIKSLSYKNEKASEHVVWDKAPNRPQWQVAISTIANDFKLCKVDPLGKVYDILSFDEFFEKNK